MTLAVIPTAQGAVFFVHVLDDALAAIAARQIQIDVGPLAALFRQEALEQQIHGDRIDRGDPEAVADGAVGGAPASLHEDVVLPAEVDDVPDDQEITGEVQLLDEIELARNLRARPIVVRAVSIARADLGHLPQERRLRLAWRNRIVREPVTEIGHRVLQAIRKLARAGDGVRPIAEERGHVRGRLEVSLGVRRESAPRLRERGVVVNARDDIEQRPLGRRRKPHAVGRDDGHVERRREMDERLVVGFLVAAEVPLQLDVHAAAAEQARQGDPSDRSPHRAGHSSRRPARWAPRALAAGERDEAAGRAVQIVQRQRAFAFRRAHFHAGDQPAQISIALLAFAEDGQRQGRERLDGRDRRDRSFLPSCLALPALLPIVSSAPMIARSPAAAAALWNRGAP